MTTTRQMTSEGKEALRKTIRGLRAGLVDQLQEEAERVYRLGVSLEKAKLPEAKAKNRARLEAWLDEQSRAETGPKKGSKKPNEKALTEGRTRYLKQAVKEAAHTLLNRLVILRLMEEGQLSQPAVVTGGWKSAGYREFQEYAGALCADTEDGSRGYWSLLQLLFDEHALELPGVFGQVGLTALFPVPAAALREVIEALNNPALDSVWSDDTTLGWIYQFWNDPDRESLDAKINGGGKIEPHEIASKTQMFTERYMVEWLLQNSLGQTWLAMCQQHSWTPDFEQVRADLDARRADWRKNRETGEVAPEELMPIHSELEHQWKYWVPQPMPADAPAAAPNHLRDLKLLDPACGSGHFLVIAFDLLAVLYQEEGRHTGQPLTPVEIARSIVEQNLHGVDIDPRAIQIAAAALWLKAKLFAPDVRLGRLNLVAPTFNLAALPTDDPTLVELKKRLKIEVGVAESVTTSILEALRGVDHLGTLLRVDQGVRQALRSYKGEFFELGKSSQTTLFGEAPADRIQLSLPEAEASVVERLGRFLDAHEGAGDLGLRLEGEQLAAGVRFLQMVREGTFDVVVGNPPYQGTSKLAEADWYKKHYPRSKADLYACFLERGLELAKPGGVSALLTMRGWMFLSSYQHLREGLLKENELSVLGDIDRGGFADIPDEVVAASMSVFSKRHTAHQKAVSVQPTPLEDKSRDSGRTARKKAALLAQVRRFEFDVAKLSGIQGTPLVYWWDEAFLEEYVKAPKLGEVAPIAQGLITSDNARFLRRPWEAAAHRVRLNFESDESPWVPYVKGAQGRAWLEPLVDTVRWCRNGLQIKTFERDGRIASRPQNEHLYFRRGVAFSPIGQAFTARVHRWIGIFDSMGSSAFPPDLWEAVAAMNSRRAATTLESLNPTVHFQVGDVAKLAISEIEGSSVLRLRLLAAFVRHESHREASVEFKQPGPSPWRHAQDWAQSAVDRPKVEPLPPYEEQLDPPELASFVSFAIGVALGRFGENGEGILDLSLTHSNGAQAKALSGSNEKSWAGAKTSGPSEGVDSALDGLEVPNIGPHPLPAGQEILPDGILFLSGAPHIADSTSHPAFARIERAWSEQGTAISAGKKTSLEDWLRSDFFAYHKGLYENRPIYFPLSSESKSFVAWVSIHRWADNTLQSLLAHYLHPAREKLEGEINDLNQARASGDKKAQSAAEKQYAKTQKLSDELEQFITSVTQLAEKGAPPVDPKCKPRDADARFRMDLDDGVMINSAALWPLLEPQWKDPKKWWKQLSEGEYDWANLAAQYFPDRVDAKCKEDPSLGVAHGCFWKYHPAKAYAWELRLQDEIGPHFTIDEADSDVVRSAFLRDFPSEVAEVRAKEEQRRQRARRKAEGAEKADDAGELFAAAAEEAEVD